ncbi:hypothetical protein PENTCL1PPCAC_20469, partial [Pristionchus entomophagus]
HIFHFKYLPQQEILLTLPQMEEMHILNRREVPAELFLHLITTHKLVHLHNMNDTCRMIGWRKLKQAMEMISANESEQTVRLDL